MNADRRLISNRTSWLGWLALATAAGIVALFAIGTFTGFNALQQFSMWVFAGLCFAFGAVRLAPPRLSELVAYLGYICIFSLLFAIVFEFIPVTPPRHLPDPTRIIENYDFSPLWEALSGGRAG